MLKSLSTKNIGDCRKICIISDVKKFLDNEKEYDKLSIIRKGVSNAMGIAS